MYQNPIYIKVLHNTQSNLSNKSPINIKALHCVYKTKSHISEQKGVHFPKTKSKTVSESKAISKEQEYSYPPRQSLEKKREK